MSFLFFLFFDLLPENQVLQNLLVIILFGFGISTSSLSFHLFVFLFTLFRFPLLVIKPITDRKIVLKPFKVFPGAKIRYIISLDLTFLALLPSIWTILRRNKYTAQMLRYVTIFLVIIVCFNVSSPVFAEFCGLWSDMKSSVEIFHLEIVEHGVVCY